MLEPFFKTVWDYYKPKHINKLLCISPHVIAHTHLILITNMFDKIFNISYIPTPRQRTSKIWYSFTTLFLVNITTQKSHPTVCFITLHIPTADRGHYPLLVRIILIHKSDEFINIEYWNPIQTQLLLFLMNVFYAFFIYKVRWVSQMQFQMLFTLYLDITKTEKNIKFTDSQTSPLLCGWCRYYIHNMRAPV